MNPADLTVTANNVLKTYGQTPILTAFTTVGLMNSETVGSVTETSSGTAVDARAGVSTYAITPSNATGGTFTPSNYTITYVNGTMTVIPLIRPVTDVVPTETHQIQLMAMLPGGALPGGLGGLNLTVIDAGVRIPLIPLADTQPVRLEPLIVPAKTQPVQPEPAVVPTEMMQKSDAPHPALVVVPVEKPLKLYVPPYHPPKQDRN